MPCQPMKSLFSLNTMMKELVDMNSSLQMILIVLSVWVIIKEMKNGFNVQYTTFGSAITAFTTD